MVASSPPPSFPICWHLFSRFNSSSPSIMWPIDSGSQFSSLRAKIRFRRGKTNKKKCRWWKRSRSKIERGKKSLFLIIILRSSCNDESSFHVFTPTFIRVVFYNSVCAKGAKITVWNFIIFLSLRFYVKSILGILEVQKIKIQRYQKCKN